MKKAIGIPRCRWEDNIKMDLQEMELEGVDVDQIKIVFMKRLRAD
jgi:hypothetical protein